MFTFSSVLDFLFCSVLFCYVIGYVYIQFCFRSLVLFCNFQLSDDPVMFKTDYRTFLIQFNFKFCDGSVMF
jgi:hypothetical protein